MKVLQLLIIIPFFLNAQLHKRKNKVLFIGNSYTYVNNLPQLIHDVALANGDSLIFDSNCPGGYTFMNHSVDAQTLAKINLGIWDYVILQAQSQEPAFSPAQVNAQTLPYAIALDTAIKNHNTCASTVFYETWGRKFGDASNCPFYPPICTYTGMQNSLKQSYKLFADSTHGLMAPVGEAFRKSIQNNPNLELYQSDQSHPSLEGSYLAACVFYEVLFQKSVLSNTYNPGIGTSTLSFLQQTAHSVLADSLLVWNIGVNSPKAEFTYSTLTTNNYQFDATYPWLNHIWYFGDGTSNLGASLQHQYNSGGIKTVSHVVYDGCKRDSITTQINVLLSTTIHVEQLNHYDLRIFPNPVNTYFQLNAVNEMENKLFSGDIYNALGQKVMSFEKSNEINVGCLTNGIYFVKVSNLKEALVLRFVKQANE